MISDTEERLLKFEELCKKHDLTYEQSSDYSAVKRGRESYQKILNLASILPRPKVVVIWNKYVDRSISEAYRSQYYWKN